MTPLASEERYLGCLLQVKHEGQCEEVQFVHEALQLPYYQGTSMRGGDRKWQKIIHKIQAAYCL